MRLAKQTPVEFECEGQTVSGTLHMPKKEGQKPVVLLCHGFTGNRIESHFIFVKMSRELEKRGIASLRFDFRGSGESDGRFQDMTILTEIADARSGLDFLSGVDGIDGERIGVLGFSLGGCVSACVSPDPRVKSLVLWSAVARLNDMMMERLKVRGLKLDSMPDTVDLGGLLVGRGFYEATARVDPGKSVEKCTAPVLVIHGDEDQAVPVENGRDLYDAASKREARAEMKVVTGANHTYANAALEKQVLADTADWFEETL